MMRSMFNPGLSCSAKAKHPVIAMAAAELQSLAMTVSPAFAGDDTKEFSP